MIIDSGYEPRLPNGHVWTVFQQWSMLGQLFVGVSRLRRLDQMSAGEPGLGSESQKGTGDRKDDGDPEADAYWRRIDERVDRQESLFHQYNGACEAWIARFPPHMRHLAMPALPIPGPGTTLAQAHMGMMLFMKTVGFGGAVRGADDCNKGSLLGRWLRSRAHPDGVSSSRTVSHTGFISYRLADIPHSRHPLVVDPPHRSCSIAKGAYLPPPVRPHTLSPLRSRLSITLAGPAFGVRFFPLIGDISGGLAW
ncbi:hypothetical protein CAUPRSCDRAFT_12404 [Caulochytrium protostelioides]|uniref:Uncharacterized protein n=1 Tax=Caulochytrium protostelioides TaxID=1555241 RepID=A0A4P9WXA3_9FUNG|nr:hypothetical protein CAUPRSCDRAFT_12404 [Caulochytrium protostelioides]